MMKKTFLGLGAALLLSTAALGQGKEATPAGAAVVAACNGATIYTVGTTPPITQDPKGNACSSASGGGGGGGAVTVANGADVTQGTINDTHTQGTVVGYLKDVWTALTTGPVPVSAAALPLPANAAQETGGNLATIAGAVTSSVVQSNTKQVNGATTQAGAGAVGTGSQRVAVAQDATTVAGSAPGTAGTPSTNVLTVQGATSMTKLLVTPDSVALPANQSVNQAQVAGTTTDTNSGNKSAGTQRVVIATDQPSLTNAFKVDGSGVTQPISAASNVPVSQATASSLNAQVVGAVASAGANAGNPVKLGGVVATAQPSLSNGNVNDVLMSSKGGVIVTPQFGVAVTTGSINVGLYDQAGNTRTLAVGPTLYNGSTNDAALSATNGLNSTGTGIQDTASVDQFDDVSPTTITENQFGLVRMSANRNQYGTIRDAAGNERGANVDASNNLQVNSNASLAFTPVAPATATATKGQLSGGQYNATPVTATDGQQMSAQYDSHGSQKGLQVDSTGAAIDYTQNISVAPGPGGRVDVSCSTGNVAAATATCTMPATTGKTTYVTGFDITGSGATVGVVVVCTLTNVNSGTHSYVYAAAAGVLAANTPMTKNFQTPLKATASNTAPVLSCPSLGTGNTNMSVNVDGYEL